MKPFRAYPGCLIDDEPRGGRDVAQDHAALTFHPGAEPTGYGLVASAR